MEGIGFIILLGVVYGLAGTIFIFGKLFKKHIEMGDSKGSSYDFSGLNMRFISKH